MNTRLQNKTLAIKIKKSIDATYDKLVRKTTGEILPESKWDRQDRQLIAKQKLVRLDNQLRKLERNL